MSTINLMVQVKGEVGSMCCSCNWQKYSSPFRVHGGYEPASPTWGKVTSWLQFYLPKVSSSSHLSITMMEDWTAGWDAHLTTRIQTKVHGFMVKDANCCTEVVDGPDALLFSSLSGPFSTSASVPLVSSFTNAWKHLFQSPLTSLSFTLPMF